MDIVAELEKLQQRREALSRELTGLDAQLIRVRDVLGYGTATRVKNAAKGHRYVNGSGEHTRAQIMAALAEREPLRPDQLKERVGTTTAGITAAAMAAEGLLVRRRIAFGRMGGRAYLYARTAAAFDGNTDVEYAPTAAETAATEEATDDEVG